MCHDVRLAAGRVADGQKDRFIFEPQLREYLVTPSEPSHLILYMLEQIRTQLSGQLIGHGAPVVQALATSKSIPFP